MTQEYVNKRWGQTAVRRVDVHQCDECGSEYLTPYKAIHAVNDALTFCSKACNKQSRSTGALARKWRKTKLARYGVEYSSQVPGASEKMLATRVERFGTTAPIHCHDQISARWHKTIKERYGVDYPSQAPGAKAKCKATMKERFGCNPLALPENRTHLSEAGQKGYRALIHKRGDVMLSKPEAMLAVFLREHFGNENVEQQVPIDHGGRKMWLIDFYVKTIDTFVEADGVFWHGLDKDYDLLHPMMRAKYDADREQDKWFLFNAKKLVRITDKELIVCHQSNDWSNVAARLGG